VNMTEALLLVDTKRSGGSATLEETKAARLLAKLGCCEWTARRPRSLEVRSTSCEARCVSTATLSGAAAMHYDACLCFLIAKTKKPPLTKCFQTSKIQKFFSRINFRYLLMTLRSHQAKSLHRRQDECISSFRT